MTTTISKILLLCFTFFSLLSPLKAHVIGFSTDLIHRDSPASPFYDPLLTPFHHALNALRRSHNRVKSFASATKNVNSTSSVIVPSNGEYLMKITLGTPPFSVFVIPDTGSDLTWTQCVPCKHCWKQKALLFDPRKSSTFKTYAYNSSKCRTLDERYKDTNGTCEYGFQYGSGYSHGTLASETLILEPNSSQPLYFPGITLGCGYNNGGLFEEDQSGIVGLGGGSLSLVSQIKPFIDAKFSYCLTPTFSKTRTNGRINFGKNAVVSGKKAVSTPIIPKPNKTSYYLNLEAISVGKHRIELFNSSSAAVADAGNIIIDSGATLTYLPWEVYFKFLHLVKKFMGDKTVPSPQGDDTLCYEVSDKLSYPRIKAHFTGATIDLKPINTFFQVGENVTCLAFNTKIGEGISPIFGNVAQTNFLIGFDTAKGTVTFKPTICGHGSH